MKISKAACFCSLFAASVAHSQKKSEQIVDVIVDCTCSDSVGKGYARSLRDEIANSPRYREITDSKEARKNSFRIAIVTVAIDDDSQGASSSTAISIVFIIDGIFLDQVIQTCGQSATVACAKKTLNAFDDDMSELRKNLK